MGDIAADNLGTVQKENQSEMTGRKAIAWLALYLVIFAVVFLQFPLQGSLPGKLDTWFYLNAFRSIGNYLQAWLTGVPVGTALYPEAALYLFGNYSFGQSVFYLPFQWLGMNDIWAYYCFAVCLFALNAWSVMALAGVWIKSRPAAFAAGLIFASTNFMFGNLDNPDAIFLAPGIAAVWALWKWSETRNPAFVLLAGLLGGAEVYFSSYAFLFTAVLMAVTLVFTARQWASWRMVATGLAGFAMFLLVIWPYCDMYIFTDRLSSGYNPAHSIKVADAVSLTWEDLFTPLPDNLFYAYRAKQEDNWIFKAKSAFTGFLIPLLGIIGWAFIRRRGWFIAAFVVFVLLAIGPYVGQNDHKAPLYFLYEHFHIHNLFRISIRAYFFAILVLVVPAVFLAHRWSQRTPWPRLVFAGFVVLMLAENVPLKLRTYNSAELMQLSRELPDFDNGAVLLNLPSSFYSGHIPGFRYPCEESKVNYEFEFLREYQYVYQQTVHEANTVNGFPGFIPHTRMRNQRWIQDVGSQGYLDSLIHYNKLDYLVWHKAMENGCDYSGLMDFFSNSPLLTLETELPNHLIYRCNR